METTRIDSPDDGGWATDDAIVDDAEQHTLPKRSWLKKLWDWVVAIFWGTILGIIEGF